MIPLTAFEERVKLEGSTFSTPDWTSLGEESNFFAALGNAIRITEIGRSVEDRPMRLVSVGSDHGACRVLVIAEQHGNEPAGREGALMFLRDLATSDDAEIQAYLAEFKWCFITTANPDRLAQTRANANGVDLNRDHIEVSQPETKALHRIMHSLRPKIVLDLHETTSSFDVLTYLWPLNSDVAPMLREGAEYLGVNRIGRKLSEHDLSHDVYPSTGTEAVRLLCNYSGLCGTVGLLLESSRRSAAGIPRKTRAQAHRLALQATLEWDIEEGIRVDALVRRGVEWAHRTRTHTVYSGEAYGYILPDEAAILSDLHGVTYVPIADGLYANMSQQNSRLMPYLMDTSSSSRVFNGIRRQKPMPMTHVREDQAWIETLITTSVNGAWGYR